MSADTFHDGRVTLHGGDCLDVMAGMEAASVDAIVTDPPYELGFMGRAWDKSGIAFESATWAAALRVLKPGGHLVAFAAPKNAHRMVCAIEDAGFEIRDSLMWVFGSGFPKSLDVSKEIDKAVGAKRESGVVSGRSGAARSCMAGSFAGGEYMKTDAATPEAARWQGWGTALKPAYEPICLARKPLGERTVAANVLAHGTGALNIDACRIAGETPSIDRRAAAEKTGRIGRQGDSLAHVLGRFRANADREAAVAAYLSPKPGESLGRWPANICHDGSDDVVETFPKTAPAKSGPPRSAASGVGWGMTSTGAEYDDAGGSAARFFYSAKADADDRLGSKHPTVKPVDLMQWLCRLVTPPGGVILDLFAGTGTTGEAALREGFRAVLIEREATYRADIARRMAHAFDGEDGRKRAIVKARGQADYSAGPLFADQGCGA